MYKYQGFHSGEKLKATQLVAMEDGIIQAQEDVKNICYEGYAYDPIEWDGVIGSRENIDVSSSVNVDPGSVYFVKLSDVILTREDCINSIIVIHSPDGEESRAIHENEVSSEAEIKESGVIGVLDYLVVVIDANKASDMLKINIQTTGVYGAYAPKEGMYVKSFSKTIIKKIDEKFLPELPSGANMEKGTGVEATQQIPRSAKTNKINAQGQLCFEGDSPYMTSEENAEVPFGALAEASISLGGRTSAQNTHSMAINSKTIAKGEESLATGYATIALGGASFSGGSQTIARAEASTALGFKNDAAAPYTFVHGVQNVAGGLYQAVFGVANENNADNLFEIGNGKLDTSGNVTQRANAFAVTRDGRVKVQNLDSSTYEENDLVPIAVMAQGFQMLEANRYIQNGKADGSTQQKYSNANAVGAAAFGTHTRANAEASMSCGAHTVADKYAQTVVGRYNVKDSRNGSLFVVGAGSDDAERINGLEVIQGGEIIVRWEGNYYSLNLMLNLIANKFGGASFFDKAKKQ